MYAIRRNRDPDARRWESGQVLGWVITADGEWAFFSREERDAIIHEIQAEELRASWWAVKDSLPSYYIADELAERSV